MAKAVNETTTWILLRDARAFLTETYQAPALAERSLIRWLEAGRVRWRCLGMEGRTQSSDPGQGAPEFWQAELVGPRNAGGSRQVIKLLHVNWAESSAYRKISPMHGYTAFRIELAREDILKFFPPAAKAPAQTAAVRWILATHLQMKITGEITTTTTPSAIARLLHQKMKVAVRSGELDRVVSESHIRNTLRTLNELPKKSA